MAVINSKEFSVSQIKANNINGAAVKERVYYEPDEDFYKSITAEEFRKKAHEVVEKAYKKYTNECNNTTGSAELS